MIVISNPAGGGTLVSGSGSGTLSFGGVGTTGSFAPGGLLLGGNLGAPADGVAILPQISLSQLGSLSSWTIAQGSTLTLNLDLIGGGAAPVNSFAIQLLNEPYFTLNTITPELPAGFTDSYDTTTGIFSGQNVSGTDISSAETTFDDGDSVYSLTPLASLTFTLDATVPLGTVLTLPKALSSSTLSDAAGDAIQSGALSITGPTVDAAPEPSAGWLLALGGAGLALATSRRRVQLRTADVSH